MAEPDYSKELGALGRKLRRFVPTASEQVLLAEFSSHRRRIPVGTELVGAHRAQDSAYVLHEGWACAYRELPDGSRQIFDFRLPGDFLGLLTLMVQRFNYTVATLTDVVVSEISTAKLISTFRLSPHMAEAVIWSLSRDSAIIAEHLVNVGCRGALARTVHLLIEIGHRLAQVGQSPPERYECPLTQKDLAEALGITHVHLNRVLRHLRDRNLLTFNDHTVVLHDMPALVRIAEFESFYLDNR